MTTPLATYRLQLHAGFDLDDAAAVAGYLAELGVSHVYCSPYLQAATGSTHGYDVVDHRYVNAELGGEAAHARFTSALAGAGLGQVLDIVPNHMAITGRENAWWWDVLENGPASRYATWFDVDWDPPEAKLRHTVLMPVLGDHYGRVLEAGEIRLAFADGWFTVHYHDHVLPVASPSLDLVLGVAAGLSASDELALLSHSLTRLPRANATDRMSVHERHRDAQVLRRQLARLCEQDQAVRAAVAEAVDAVNGDPDALDALLERQNYRLAFWRTAGQELDYRRFFDITSLVGLRAEDRDVFAATHQRVLQWVGDGVLDGVRVDHPDGLRRPAEYLERLRKAAPTAWLVVEKILEPGERLPRSWPVEGTTGYDFANLVAGLFVDPAGKDLFTREYERLTGEPTDFAEVARAAKLRVTGDVLAADVHRLANLWVAVCERHRRYRDHTRRDLETALREVLASFPVYRTYVSEDGTSAADDREHVQAAVADACRRRPELDGDLFDFLGRLLLGAPEVRGDAESELRMRFQQLTGPVMAKGVEDTALYTFNRLVALNEVGGDPGRFGVPVSAFHRACAERAEAWPAAMLALSTHDTKRSEDVRARLAVLSEMPDRWFSLVERWMVRNDRHRSGPDLPDRNAEYLLYQALVGAHPLPADRAVAYMEKAAKEADVHTSWVDPVPEYDKALRAFVEAVCADEEQLADVDDLCAELVPAGRLGSLAQKLVQLTAPGVPDTYQGTEVWDLSLVDPDNRRPVDFDQRRALLADLAGATPDDVLAGWDAGLPKLWVVQRALRLRAKRRRAFGPGPTGGYTPVLATGPAADHVVAFSRGRGQDQVVTVVPRLLTRLAATVGGWQGTTVGLDDGRWRHVLTDEEVDGGTVIVEDLLARFPVALLTRDG